MEKATCEICGKKGIRAVIFVEGAKLAVCGGCAFGKKILYLLDEEGKEKKVETQRAKTEEVEEIVEGYGKIIKKAREGLGLPISVIAERINEKESYLERIEREDVIPTFSVAKKLEKELGIKLIEKVGASVAPSSSLQKRFSEPTLGEFAEEGE